MTTSLKDELLSQFEKAWHYMGMVPKTVVVSENILADILPEDKYFQYEGTPYESPCWRTKFGSVKVLTDPITCKYSKYIILFEAPRE